MLLRLTIVLISLNLQALDIGACTINLFKKKTLNKNFSYNNKLLSLDLNRIENLVKNSNLDDEKKLKLSYLLKDQNLDESKKLELSNYITSIYSNNLDISNKLKLEAFEFRKLLKSKTSKNELNTSILKKSFLDAYSKLNRTNYTPQKYASLPDHTLIFFNQIIETIDSLIRTIPKNNTIDDSLVKNKFSSIFNTQNFKQENSIFNSLDNFSRRKYLSNLRGRIDSMLAKLNEIGTKSDLDINLNASFKDIISSLLKREKSFIEIFFDFSTWLSKKHNIIVSKPKKIVKTIEKVIFGTDDKIQSSKRIFFGNDGIREHLTKLLIKDKPFRKMSIAFYEKLALIDGNKLDYYQRARPWNFWEETQTDIWQLALDTTKKYSIDQKESAFYASRILSVFGHNDIKEFFDIKNLTLSSKQSQELATDLNLLNVFRPSRHSAFYAPNAIKGLNLPKKALAEMSDYKTKLFKLLKKESLDPELKKKYFMHSFDYMEDKIFRSGYYHYYGGFYLTNEFAASNTTHYLGTNLPVTLSYMAAWFYKTMAFKNVYLKDDYKILYDLGYNKRKNLSNRDKMKLINKIQTNTAQSWSMDRLELAKVFVDINLLHIKIAIIQHGTGARKAWNLLYSSSGI